MRRNTLLTVCMTRTSSSTQRAQKWRWWLSIEQWETRLDHELQHLLTEGSGGQERKGEECNTHGKGMRGERR